MADALDAKVNIPFAGQYILGGKLSHLNKYRGVSDAVEVLSFDSKAMVLAEGASIDTGAIDPIIYDNRTALRIEPFDNKTMEAYASSLTTPMDYMNDFKYLSPDRIPWGRLLHKAAENALAKNEYDGDTYIVAIKFLDKIYAIDLGTEAHHFIEKSLLEEPYSLIEIDYRYLFGLLTGIYHWNNAEVGSQYMTTRVPDVYNRSVQRFLNFFVV